MSTPGSRATAAGLTITMVSAGAGVQFVAAGFVLLLFCFVGVLVGASLVAAGVRMGDGHGPAPIAPVVFGSARALTAFVRRNTAALGLVMASFAVTMVSDETDPLLCFASFVLLVLAVSMISIGTRGE